MSEQINSMDGQINFLELVNERKQLLLIYNEEPSAFGQEKKTRLQQINKAIRNTEWRLMRVMFRIEECFPSLLHANNYEQHLAHNLFMLFLIQPDQKKFNLINRILNMGNIIDMQNELIKLYTQFSKGNNPPYSDFIEAHSQIDYLKLFLPQSTQGHNHFTNQIGYFYTDHSRNYNSGENEVNNFGPQNLHPETKLWSEAIKHRNECEKPIPVNSNGDMNFSSMDDKFISTYLTARDNYIENGIDETFSLLDYLCLDWNKLSAGDRFFTVYNLTTYLQSRYIACHFDGQWFNSAQQPDETVRKFYMHIWQNSSRILQNVARYRLNKTYNNPNNHAYNQACTKFRSKDFQNYLLANPNKTNDLLFAFSFCPETFMRYGKNFDTIISETKKSGLYESIMKIDNLILRLYKFYKTDVILPPIVKYLCTEKDYSLLNSIIPIELCLNGNFDPDISTSNVIPLQFRSTFYRAKKSLQTNIGSEDIITSRNRTLFEKLLETNNDHEILLTAYFLFRYIDSNNKLSGCKNFITCEMVEIIHRAKLIDNYGVVDEQLQSYLAEFNQTKSPQIFLATVITEIKNLPDVKPINFELFFVLLSSYSKNQGDRNKLYEKLKFLSQDELRQLKNKMYQSFNNLDQIYNDFIHENNNAHDQRKSDVPIAGAIFPLLPEGEESDEVFKHLNNKINVELDSKICNAFCQLVIEGGSAKSFIALTILSQKTSLLQNVETSKLLDFAMRAHYYITDHGTKGLQEQINAVNSFDELTNIKKKIWASYGEAWNCNTNRVMNVIKYATMKKNIATQPEDDNKIFSFIQDHKKALAKFIVNNISSHELYHFLNCISNFNKELQNSFIKVASAMPKIYTVDELNYLASICNKLIETKQPILKMLPQNIFSHEIIPFLNLYIQIRDPLSSEEPDVKKLILERFQKSTQWPVKNLAHIIEFYKSNQYVIPYLPEIINNADKPNIVTFTNELMNLISRSEMLKEHFRQVYNICKSDKIDFNFNDLCCWCHIMNIASQKIQNEAFLTSFTKIYFNRDFRSFISSVNVDLLDNTFRNLQLIHKVCKHGLLYITNFIDASSKTSQNAKDQVIYILQTIISTFDIDVLPKFYRIDLSKMEEQSRDIFLFFCLDSYIYNMIRYYKTTKKLISDSCLTPIMSLPYFSEDTFDNYYFQAYEPKFLPDLFTILGDEAKKDLFNIDNIHTFSQGKNTVEFETYFNYAKVYLPNESNLFKLAFMKDIVVGITNFTNLINDKFNTFLECAKNIIGEDLNASYANYEIQNTSKPIEVKIISPQEYAKNIINTNGKIDKALIENSLGNNPERINQFLTAYFIYGGQLSKLPQQILLELEIQDISFTNKQGQQILSIPFSCNAENSSSSISQQPSIFAKSNLKMLNLARMFASKDAKSYPPIDPEIFDAIAKNDMGQFITEYILRGGNPKRLPEKIQQLTITQDAIAQCQKQKSIPYSQTK